MGPVDHYGFCVWMQKNCKEEFDQLYTRYLIERPEPKEEMYFTTDSLVYGMGVIKHERVVSLEGEYAWESELKKSAVASGTKKKTPSVK